MDFSQFHIDEPWLQALAGIGVIVLVAAAANWVAKVIVVGVIRRLLGMSPFAEEKAEIGGIAARLSNIVPAVAVQLLIGLVPHLPAAAVTVTRNVASAFIVLTAGLAVTAALSLVSELYHRRPAAAARPIKGYVQVAKLVIYAAIGILMVATLIERSPLLLLSGLGAMAAVLMLVFKDTLLSLVASVQINSNDMVRLGDWIEAPHLNADGDVIDIALHTVKIQNWDKTITTVPTHRLITDPFKNWRGMQQSGGRRIKRSLMIDQTSVRFLEDDEIRSLERFSLIRDYLAQKQAEIAAWNAARPERIRHRVNARRITNIGTFRAYVSAYLTDRPDIARQMTMLVRQLAPTPEGLPLEIYAFTNTTAWAAYESIQADIFDHLLAILPDFGLRIYQQPSGHDFARIVTAVPRGPADLGLADLREPAPQ